MAFIMHFQSTSMRMWTVVIDDPSVCLSVTRAKMAERIDVLFGL